MTTNWTPMSTTRTRTANVEVRAMIQRERRVGKIHCLRYSPR